MAAGILYPSKLMRVRLNDMNSQRLRSRLELWRDKLLVVEHALEGELQKDYRSRRMGLLMFLYREKVVCINVIAELSALAEEANHTPNK
jgi:hypothetical protein